jgi:hypothetical protein
MSIRLACSDWDSSPLAVPASASLHQLARLNPRSMDAVKLQLNHSLSEEKAESSGVGLEVEAALYSGNNRAVRCARYCRRGFGSKRGDRVAGSVNGDNPDASNVSLRMFYERRNYPEERRKRILAAENARRFTGAINSHRRSARQQSAGVSRF